MPTGHGGGWSHYADDKQMPGVLTTACAIESLHVMDSTSVFINDAQEHLLSTHIDLGSATLGGGWALSSLPETPLLESTSWCAIALYESGISKDHSVLRAATKWIVGNQNEDGGWGPMWNTCSRTYCTAMALRALSVLGVEDTARAKGIGWLTTIQNPNGGWGTQLGSESSIAHTAHALIAMLESGVPETSGPVSGALAWIWQQNKGWQEEVTETYEVPVGAQRHRVAFYHYALPWVVTALLKAGESLDSPKIVRAIQAIIEGQTEEGYWRSSSETRVSLFPLHGCVVALANVLRWVGRAEHIIDLHRRVEILEEKSDQLNAAIQPITPITRPLYEVAQKIAKRYTKLYWSTVIPTISIIYALLAWLVFDIRSGAYLAAYWLLIVAPISMFAGPFRRWREKIIFSVTLCATGIALLVSDFEAIMWFHAVILAIFINLATALIIRRYSL